MKTAIRIENLSKRYRLGETHETTLSGRIASITGRLTRRAPPLSAKQPQDFWALHNVDLEIAEGEAVGIIGGNGAGKSTLLKILSRITQPTIGRALVRGRLSSLLEVGTGFHPELTGRENVFLNGTILGMRKQEVARKFDEIVAFAGVEKFVDTPVKRYSSGMYVRLAFAVAAHLEPDVLIVDEVLAVGDVEFQARCMGKMDAVAREGRTVLFVSHNMAAIQKLCTRAAWLEQGRLARVGDAATVVADYVHASQLDGQTNEVEGYLYRSTASDPNARAELVALELLDAGGNTVSSARTWGATAFRLTFDVSEAQRSFAAVISLATNDGVVLVLTSTTPDHDVFFGVEPGRYVVVCEFDCLPLAAGDYRVGIGLAVPRQEYLWRNDAVARLRVESVDIFDSGLPPKNDRYLVATPHRWNRPVAVKSTDHELI